MFLRASTNNRASTLLGYFQEALNLYNLPSRVCNDLGMENIEVASLLGHLFTTIELTGSGVK